MPANDPWTKEHFERAAKFYDESPTGQYDAEAAFALRDWHRLVDMIVVIQDANVELHKRIRVLEDDIADYNNYKDKK